MTRKALLEAILEQQRKTNLLLGWIHTALENPPPTRRAVAARKKTAKKGT